MKTDFRNPAAIARDEWIDSQEGKDACDASTLGTNAPNYYLQNRLGRAFLAGMEAQRKINEQSTSKDGEGEG